MTSGSLVDRMLDYLGKDRGFRFPRETLVCDTTSSTWWKLLSSSYIIKIHTYIIGHYNPSGRIIDLVSHTTYVVCVNFIHKWRDQQFKVDSERQIF